MAYYNQESPHTHRIKTVWSLLFHDFFTTTITHRHDSSVFSPYFQIVRIPGSPEPPPSSQPQTAVELSKLSADVIQLSKRPNLVLWMVSNCHPNSMRDHYVHELSKYVQVSVELWLGSSYAR